MTRFRRALAFIALALILPACEGGGDTFLAGVIVRLVSPQGPGVWVAGSVHTVRWSTEGATLGSVDIESSVDHATWTPMVSGTANDGAETVTAPAGVASPFWVRVRQSGGSSSDETRSPISIVADSSDLFVGQLAGPPNLSQAAADWGDFDNDGDLDLVISGFNVDVDPPVTFSEIYRNEAGTLVSINAGLPDLVFPALAWGDYDRDGDLDLALSGDTTGAGATISRIYRNDAGAFVDIVAGLPGASNGSLDWGDYDSDGDLDLAWSSGALARVYRNDAGTFIDLAAGLAGGGARDGLRWGDYDGDGDLDLIVRDSPFSQVYRNDLGTFVDSGALIPVALGSNAASWGDFDNDGDLDVAGPQSIHRNDAGAFVNLPGVPAIGRPEGGDFDNDGDLDLGGVVGPKILRNDAGSFVNTGVSLVNVGSGQGMWVDYDGDGDLDFFATGSEGAANASGFTRMYRNLGADRNTPPTAPAGLVATPAAGAVTLRWNPSSDFETPPSGLSYAIQFGIGGLPDTYPSMHTTGGVRRVSASGPIRPGVQPGGLTLTLPSGTYSWSVQAVDSGFSGSPWAAVGTFTIP